MQAERSHRGWVAVITVAVTLTLVFLAVEKHSRELGRGFYVSSQVSSGSKPTTESRGILLTLDPGIATVEQILSANRAALNRTAASSEAHSADIVALLRTPFEPAAQVVLHAPTPSDTDTLPLHASSSDSEYLVEAIAKAFESPMRPVSAVHLLDEVESAPLASVERLTSLQAPTAISSDLPEPRSLLAQIALLQERNATSVSPSQHGIANWAERVEKALGHLVQNFGSDRSRAESDFAILRKLASEAISLGSEHTDYELASQLLQISYALERRLTVWNSVHACLNQSTEQLVSFTSKQIAREQLSTLIGKIDAELLPTGDRDDWRKFLMLGELRAWSGSPEADWERGHALAVQVLSRLTWHQLTEQQRKFLSQESYQQLTSHLIPWASKPVDYRRLLTELETMEEDSINRCRSSVADVIQTLSVSTQSSQKLVAAAINEHYRNANVRIAVAGSLLNRLMPSEGWEARPVKQRILGADTSGDSAFKTRLNLSLVPDPNAWHIDLKLDGDMHSSTRASKGPAVFHSSSVAQISSQRTIRMDSQGYTVNTNGTDVDAQQFLRGFSTNFDSLPVIGDIVRLLVREQFDQQRGLAQRVVRRLIAQETDQELDKQLEENLEKAQAELIDRLIGPLQSLNLDPMVVSMSTTEERLAIRYRVASQSQMASFTARPRAPGDSWLSVQLHESAINNTIDQVGLEGRSWTLPQLTEMLAKAFKQNQWQLPDDVPHDITVRFADTRSMSVELTDGRLELTLRIAELSQPGRLHLERFIVKTSYVPAADGLQAALVRDDFVSIDGPRLGMGDRLQIRAIFAKIFAARSTFPLISDRWRKDPRAQGLAVSQVEVRDGWLALAISDQNSPHAQRTSIAARELLLTR